MPRPSLFTEEEKQKIESGKYYLIELAEEFNKPYSTLYAHARKKGSLVLRRTPLGKTVKDHNIFKTWNIDTAYLAGFILADGYLHKTKNRGYVIDVTLARKDRSHIEKIKQLINTTSPVTDYESKYPFSRILVYSKTIFNDLISIGVTPNKTYTAKWIDKCPKEFIPHLVRGFFDGDGCIHLMKHKNRLQNSIAISFSGTESVMSGLMDSFSKHYGNKIGRVYKADDGEYYYYSFSGNRVGIAFCEWIYKDSDDSNRLDRKYLRYKNFMDEYVKNPRTHLYIKRNNGISVDHSHNNKED